MRSTEVFRGIGEQVSGVLYLGSGRLGVSTWAGNLFPWMLEDHTLGKPLVASPSAISHAACEGGSRVVALDRDGVVSLRDTVSGKELHRSASDPTPVRTAAFDHLCTRLAVGRANGKVRVWDLARWNVVSEFDQRSRIVALRFAAQSNRLFAFAVDGVLVGWDLPSGREVLRHGLQTNRFTAAAFSPDGERFVHAGPEGELNVIRTATGERIASLRGHHDAPYRLAFDPDGDKIVSASAAKDVILWDLNRLADLPVEPRGHAAEIHGIAVNPHANEIITGGTDMTIRWWNAETGALLHVSRSHRARINTVLADAHGERIVSASIDGVMQLWDAATRTSLRTVDAGAAAMNGAFSPDAKAVVTAHLDGSLKLWDASSGALVRSFEPAITRYSDVDFSRDGRQVATTASDGRLRVFDVESGRLVRDEKGHEGDGWGVSWGPDGSLLTAGEDGKLLRWPPGKGPPKAILTHDGRLTKAVFHPDGRRLVVTGSKGLVRILDPDEDGPLALRGHRHRDVNTAVFEPGGEVVVTVGDDGTVRRWRVADGVPVWRAPLLLHKRPILASHAGWLALGGGELRDAPTRWRDGVETHARRAALTPDDRFLCMTTHGGELQRWDTTRDALVFRKQTEAEIVNLVATASGCWLQGIDGQTWRVDSDGTSTSVLSGATAMGTVGPWVLIARDHQVVTYDPRGERSDSAEVDVGVTAVGGVGDWLAVGYREGGLEIVSRSGPRRRRTAFEQLPMSAVERIVEGPMGTLVAGYASGFVGIWDTETGVRLAHFGLHGPAVHLLVKGEDLFAASELGDHTVATMPELQMGYCKLLRSVWDEVPVVWEQGQVVRKPVPPDHPCRR